VLGGNRHHLRRAVVGRLGQRLVERGGAPLARIPAGRLRSTGEPFDDLLQLACLGLLKAIRGYDPRRGVMFSSYATPTIMGELRRHFRDTTWAVHVPRDLQELAQRVERRRREPTDRAGNAPTTAAPARDLGCSPGAVLEGMMAMRARRTISFDAARGDEDGAGVLGDTIGDEDAGALTAGSYERATPRL
jgi:RNA polymerase sigma-B factor